MTPDLIMSDAPDPELAEAIRANFHAYAASNGVVADRRPLTIRVERHGAVIGGLVGVTVRQWLSVDTLALPGVDRGGGLGRRLMAMAEAEAAARGCVGAFLHTIRFQAPGFYEKLGYTAFACLPHGADRRFDRVWFSKSFSL